MAQQDVQDNQLLLDALRATKRGVVTGKTWSAIRRKLDINLRGGSIQRSANYLKGRGELFWTKSKKTVGGSEYTILLLRLPKEASKEPKNSQKLGTSVSASATSSGRKRRRPRKK